MQLSGRIVRNCRSHQNHTRDLMHVSVSNVINGLKARKMNVTTRTRYRVETTLYASFVMYNGIAAIHVTATISIF